MRLIASLCDEVNHFIDENKPWLLAKKLEKRMQLHQVVSVGLFAFRVIAIYLTPVMPDISLKIARLFQERSFVWSGINRHPYGVKINEFATLSRRVEEANIQNLFKEVQSVEDPSAEQKENEKISIDDFLKIKLKVGKIIEAEEIQDSKKLLQLKVDLGSETRIIIAGIKNSYQPSEILNKHVICVSNLEARKMRFGTSEGMLLGASGTENEGVFLVTVDEGATPGMIVR